MIVTKIRLQEEHPTVLGSTTWALPTCDFNLDHTVGENGYLIKSETGFSPPALSSIVEGFDSSGVPIYAIAAEQREITLRIELIPTISKDNSDLRNDLYRFMGKSVLLMLMNDADVVAQAAGYIRMVDLTTFTNQPEIQLTILCNEGEFVADRSVAVPLASLAVATPVINYPDGSAPTGIDLKFNVSAAHSNFTISGHNKSWHGGSGDVDTQFTVSYSFLIGDVVSIATHPSNRSLTVLRGGTTIDLAGFINSGAVWPRLYPGVNTFEWTFATSWGSWSSASYLPRYWGI